MILLLYTRRLAVQPGVQWLAPDSEASVGALRTYQEGGHCGEGIHHLYATILGGNRLAPTWAIPVVTTPSHWITDLNVRVDAATQEPPGAELTWLLRSPFSFLPPPPNVPGPMPTFAHSDERPFAGASLHSSAGQI